MKRNNIVFLLSISFGMALTGSCKRDTLETSEVPAAGNYSSIESFYTQNGAELQTYIINPTEDNFIIGESGTRIIIPGNSLFDENGLPPAGSLAVNLREVYDIKTMVLSHIPTTSNGNILQSAGMFYLHFDANNISYSPDTALTVLMPSAGTIPGMKIYYGEPDLNSGMNWVVDSSSFVSDSLNTFYWFAFDSLGYGWINCDMFYQSGNPSDVIITTQVSSERNETVDLEIYLLFPSINSTMKVGNMAGPQTITAGNIPVGMQAVAAAIGVGRITHKAYFGKINFTVSAPQSNISVSVVQMTDQQIFNSLSNL